MKPTHDSERRRSKRRELLTTFSLFAVVPQKGPLRLTVHDLSEDGIGFDLDIEEEVGILTASAPDLGPNMKVGSPLEVHLYLNQSLYLPLHTSIKRVEKLKTGRRLGAEFTERGSAAYRALTAFLTMLDAVSETGVIK
jgi:hypothetical protein